MIRDLNSTISLFGLITLYKILLKRFQNFFMELDSSFVSTEKFDKLINCIF